MEFIDRRYFSHFNWINFTIITLLALIGVIFVFSATYSAAQPFSVYFKKQLFGVISGILLYVGVCTIDYRTLMRIGYFMYFVVLGLLVFTIIKGSVSMGGQRWINVFFFKLQPSELAKVFFPAYATYYFYTHKKQDYLYFSDFVPILCMLIASVLLIRKQPDLGTALILLFSGLVMLWLVDIGRAFFITSACIVLLGAPFLWKVALKEYQKQRILVFLGEGSTHKERYQIEQSKIAIGSGGVRGKGYMHGTQNQLQFLPERRTDFIFSVIAEECGFFGTMTIMALFVLLFARLLLDIARIKDAYAQLLALGLIVHLMFSTFVNIGMVVGLLPIVGIPLPLVSYGLSNLWSTFISLGWINSILMRRRSIGDILT